MKIEHISDIDSFLDLEDDWNSLHIKSNTTIFQSYNFNYLSWKHQLSKDSRNKLCILVNKYKDYIDCIFPFYLNKRNQLKFINDIHMDFCDIISTREIDFSPCLFFM